MEPAAAAGLPRTPTESLAGSERSAPELLPVRLRPGSRGGGLEDQVDGLGGPASSSEKGRRVSRLWSIRKTPTWRLAGAGRWSHSIAASWAVRRAWGESRSKRKARKSGCSSAGRYGRGAGLAGGADGDVACPGVTARPRAADGVHEPDREHLLRHPVLEHFDVGGLEVAYEPALLVPHHEVHGHARGGDPDRLGNGGRARSRLGLLRLECWRGRFGAAETTVARASRATQRARGRGFMVAASLNRCVLGMLHPREKAAPAFTSFHGTGHRQSHPDRRVGGHLDRRLVIPSADRLCPVANGHDPVIPRSTVRAKRREIRRPAGAETADSSGPVPAESLGMTVFGRSPGGVSPRGASALVDEEVS